MSAENGDKQAFPHSITGDVNEPRASVLDHKFGVGDATGALELADDVRVVGVVAKTRRRP